MNVGSLFSGYGGLDLAVESVFDASPAWFCENEAAPSKVLTAHWPSVPNLGDITAVDWSVVEPVDIVTGGYPCQPFSLAGRRRGTDDARHLWPYVADAIGALRPRLTIFENVRGHLSLGFDQVLRDLDLLGYAAHWTVLRASDVGAPHGRARLFILGRDRGRQLRGWPHRRRGLYRNREGWGLSEPAVESFHDGQGADGTGGAETDLRRPGDLRAEAERSGAPERLHLASEWGAGSQGHITSGAATASEGRSRADRPGTGCDDVRCGAGSSARGEVDARDVSTGGHSDRADSGGEPSRPGPRTADAACASSSGGDSQVGRMVGAGRGSIRPDSVHGGDPDERPNDSGTHLRAADIGAPHGRFRVFVVAHARRGAIPVESLSEPRGGIASLADRDHGPTTDAARDGRHQGRPEPAGLIGGSDAAECSATATDAEGSRDALVALINDGAALGGSEFGAGRGDSAGDFASRVQRLDAGARQEWGQYAPAIHRWERIIGRPAPAPTEPGTRGGQRLSPRLVEWMMGLPDGWVTSVPDISRNDQLKMLGNGVVPQQAAEAIRYMVAAELLDGVA